MSKHISIRPVERVEFDLDTLALALLDVIDELDGPTLQALSLDGQRAIEKLELPVAHLQRRESAA